MNMSIVFSAIDILNQPKEYLNNISDSLYAEKQSLLSGSSIGEHTRHFIEFFQCLIAQSNEQMSINYDKRVRNKLIEENSSYALDQIEEIQRQLGDWADEKGMNEICKIETIFDSDQILSLDTTIERELLYNIEHAIHHLAIIKIGLKNINAPLELSDDFGVAKSTMVFRAQKI